MVPQLRDSHRHVTSSIRLWALLICLVTLSASGRETAGTDPPRYPLRISSQPLEESLQEFARQSGLQIVFFPSVTAGLRAPPIEGTYSVAAAMAQLLSGTDLTFRVINPDTIEVLRSPPGPTPTPARREPQPVHTDGKPASMEEVLIQTTAEQLVSTRVPTPLREIPQTIAMVPQEQVRTQNDTSLADVLAHATGISTFRSNSLDQAFYARGFEITSFHVDGGAALSSTILDKALASLFVIGSPDLSEFDRIEVLRGSDALFAGNGNPGGTVSLVRKRPGAVSEIALNASAGYWNDYRVEMDATGPLAAEGAFRGRADGVFARSDYFYQGAKRERKRAFAVLEYDLAADATITAGGSFQRDESVPVMLGLPMYANGDDPRLPRNTSLAFDWAFYRTRSFEGYVQYRQKLAQDWKLKINAALWDTSMSFAYGNFSSLIDPGTQGIDSPPGGIVTRAPNRVRQRTIDATLTGQMDWFGLRQELAIGGDFTRFTMQPDIADPGPLGPPLSSVRDFNPVNYPRPPPIDPPLLAIRNTTVLDQYGVFASLRMFLDPKWSVFAGARLASDHSVSDTWLSIRTTTVGPIEVDSGTHRVVTPLAAVVYRIADHYSWYASYADIYKSGSTAQRSDGKLLGPAHGVNYETGLKGAWNEGALNGTLALYRIEQKNLRILDPAPKPPGASDSYCCFIGGTAHSHGVDLEINGEVQRGWLIGGGYTYNTTRSETGGPIPLLTPMHLLKIWTNVRLPEPLSHWTLGASVYAQTRILSEQSNYCPPGGTYCVAFNVVQSPYAVFNLHAGFDFDANWRVALTLNNVLDKKYYESLDRPPLRDWYGEPRNLMLRVDWKL